MSDALQADLDRLVATYKIDTVWEQYKRLEFLSKLEPYVDLPHARVLELGSAEGDLTALLAERCARVVAVDGSPRFLTIARSKVQAPHVEFVEALFETLMLDERFDLVVLHHVLEHVGAPIDVLRSARAHCTPHGLVAATVPNAHALSRQLAVKMGLLSSVYTLTANDHHHGHQRVYDWTTFESDATAAGFEIAGRHGLALKLFADFQTERMIDAGIIGDAQLRGLWPLADEQKDVAGATMLVLRAAATPT